MKRKPISDGLEFSEAQQKARLRNRLIIYPIITFVLSAVTLFPPVSIIVRGRQPSILVLIPGVFGILLLYKGIRMLVINRKEFMAYFSKQDNQSSE